MVCLCLTWQFFRISLKSPVLKLIWISIIPFYPWACYSYYSLSACHSLLLLRKNWVWDSWFWMFWIMPLLLILVSPCFMKQSMRMCDDRKGLWSLHGPKALPEGGWWSALLQRQGVGVQVCGLPWEVSGKKLNRGNHISFVPFVLVLQDPIMGIYNLEWNLLAIYL